MHLPFGFTVGDQLFDAKDNGNDTTITAVYGAPFTFVMPTLAFDAWMRGEATLAKAMPSISPSDWRRLTDHGSLTSELEN